MIRMFLRILVLLGSQRRREALELYAVNDVGAVLLELVGAFVVVEACADINR